MLFPASVENLLILPVPIVSGAFCISLAVLLHVYARARIRIVSVSVCFFILAFSSNLTCALFYQQATYKEGDITTFPVHKMSRLCNWIWDSCAFCEGSYMKIDHSITRKWMICWFHSTLCLSHMISCASTMFCQSEVIPLADQTCDHAIFIHATWLAKTINRCNREEGTRNISLFCQSCLVCPYLINLLFKKMLKY